MVLVLLSEGANDFALGLNLSLQVIVSLLHQKHFLFLFLLLFQ